VHAVIRLVWHTIKFARGRSLALGTGMLVAAVAFALLTANVEVNTARIQGAVGRNWRGSYDLVVLPANWKAPSVKATGADGGVIQLNYLTTATSGITLRQYHEIEKLPDVGVAAPLAIVGYVLQTIAMPVDLSSVSGGTGAKVFLLSSQVTADDGLSRYPVQPQSYVYVTPDRLSPLDLGQGESGYDEHLPDGSTAEVCHSFGSTEGVEPTPFGAPLDAATWLNMCYSRRGHARPTGYVMWSFPMLLAGIDPGPENALTHLAATVTSGAYLGPNEEYTIIDGRAAALPVLASTVPSDGDSEQVTVSVLPPAAVGVVRNSAPDEIARPLTAEHGTPVLRVTITAGQAWRRWLAELDAEDSPLDNAQLDFEDWTTGPIRYRTGPGGRLTPVSVSSDPASAWLATDGDYVDAPPDAADTAFRTLTEHFRTGAAGPITSLNLVGTFDPSRLPGFSGVGPGGPLASYRAPELTGADAASRAVLGGGPLLPDANIAGYAQPPPLLYTTLTGAVAAENPASFTGTQRQAAAPIGSIRIRVSGLHGTLQQELDTIAQVSQRIHQATGLKVVVTAGASPQPVTVSLPAGRYGRPALRLSESWAAIGVALVVLGQADRESLALFVLILLVCGLYLGGASLAGVRSRRGEIGVLRTFGWGRGRVFAMVLGEVLLLGVLAGVTGGALSAGLIAGLGLAIPMWHAAAVLPVAVLLACGSGVVPAWHATRIQPSRAVLASPRSPRRRGRRRIRTVTALAVSAVLRMPGRSALEAAGLAVGVAGVTVLIAVQVSFRTAIGASALGGLVTSAVRPADLMAAGLTLALSAAGIADLTYLGLRERTAELAVLAATGWSRPNLRRLLGTEAAVIASVGALAGGLVGLAVTAAAFGFTSAMGEVAAAAAVGGAVVTLAVTMAAITAALAHSVTTGLSFDE
jgi:putative ABC transport system permease protein